MIILEELRQMSIGVLEIRLTEIDGKPRKILGFIPSDKRFKEEIDKIVA